MDPEKGREALLAGHLQVDLHRFMVFFELFCDYLGRVGEVEVKAVWLGRLWGEFVSARLNKMK